jgi:hypothetical protein
MTRALSALGLVLGLALIGTGCQAARVSHDLTAPPGLLRYDTIQAHSNCQNARPHLFGRHAGLHARRHGGGGGMGHPGYDPGGQGAYCPDCQPGLGGHGGFPGAGHDGLSVRGHHGFGVAGFNGTAHQQLYTDQPHAGPNGPPTGQYAYPYYTTRGPRDFLQNNPPSIGPGSTNY